MYGAPPMAIGPWVRPAKSWPVKMMSTVPRVRPWLMSVSLPSDEAGKTSTTYLLLVRLAISPAAQTAAVWYGSLVSYTWAHFNFVCAATPVDTASARTASAAVKRFMAPPLVMERGLRVQKALNPP